MSVADESELLRQAVTVFTWSLKLLEEKVHKQQQQKQVNLTSNKMLKFFAIKDLINRVQRQLMEWRNICKHLSNPEYMGNSYNSSTTKPLWAEGFEEILCLQRRYTSDIEAHENMLSIIREIQIKPTMRYHLTSIRIPANKNRKQHILERM